MSNKNSPYYTKSSYESKFYGDDSYTTFEREFKISGNDAAHIRAAGPSIKGDVMP